MTLSEKQLANQIRSGMRALRDAAKLGEEIAPVEWVIEDELACCQRPLRDHPQFGGSREDLPRDAGLTLEKWADEIDGLGIRSVICLSHAKELAHYEDALSHHGGLLGLYQSRGWKVRHIPWVDPAHEATPEARERVMQEVKRIKREALSAFEELEKPVLMHCSAGIDRSPPVAAFILGSRRGANGL